MSACSTASCVVRSASPDTVATTAGLPPSYDTSLYFTPVAFTMKSIALWPADVTPAVATLIWPGRAFMSSINCLAFCHGRDGLTPITWMLATDRNRCQYLILVFTVTSLG